MKQVHVSPVMTRRTRFFGWAGIKRKKFLLYDNLVKCVGEFEKNGVCAVLWHQGESDSLDKTPAETYL